MRILGVDLGKDTGLVIYNCDKSIVEQHLTFRVDTVLEFGARISKTLSQVEVDVIVTAYPTRFYWVIVSHSKQMGVLEYLASAQDIPVIYTNDSSAKKTVFGSGRLSNEEIGLRLRNLGINLQTEHENDAALFILDYIKKNKVITKICKKKILQRGK